MCSKCKDVLIDFKIQHDPSVCPLLRGSYCSVCASYGHTTISCPDQETLSNRKPQFVEQLISPSLLETYKITSRTPLADDTIESKGRYDPVLEVYDNDRYIRAILMNYNKAISGKVKENRIRLQGLADELGRKLIFLHPVDEDSSTKKTTKASKPKAKA